MTEVPCSKRTEPLIPVGHPQYVWTSSSDVQATWRRYGWRPVSEIRAEAEAEKLFSSAIAHTSQL